MKKWARFNVLVPAAAVVAALWLVGTPLVHNVVASMAWKQVPCRIFARQFFDYKIRYQYLFNGEKYSAIRLNFWQKDYGFEKDHDPAIDEFDDTCWVNPNDPRDTVLRLDAFTNWSYSFPRVSAAILVLIAAFILTLAGRKKKPDAAPRGRAGNRMNMR